MNITHLQAKAAEERVTGERFCSTCQRYRAIEGGAFRITGKGKAVKRWQCAACAARKRNFGAKP